MSSGPFFILILMDGFGPEEDKQAAHPPSKQTTNEQQQQGQDGAK